MLKLSLSSPSIDLNFNYSNVFFSNYASVSEPAWVGVSPSAHDQLTYVNLTHN